ncbi:MAG TPA: DUF3788 family protein [Terracidiphilus sp.]|nr:DUF3788 family protein [Terracidiphilus sp.]
MEYTNAFVGKIQQPTDTEVAEALGPAADMWSQFIQWMAEEEAVTEQEWKGIAVKKYGWSLRLKQKSRNVLYLGPGIGCFMVSFALSDKALSAAKAAKLPKAVQSVLEKAPRYPEGNGVRLLVKSSRDLSAIRKIAQIKLAA